jgi:large subunit ribosomal protein LP1
VKELLSNVGSGGGAPAAGAPASGGGAAPATEAPAEEKKEEEKEESDEDMVRIYSVCFYVLSNANACIQ